MKRGKTRATLAMSFALAHDKEERVQRVRVRLFVREIFLVIAAAAVLIELSGCPNPAVDLPPSNPVEQNPKIVIHHDAVELSSGDTLLFGSTVVGTPKDEVITIENNGTADLQLSGSPAVTLSGAGAAAYSVTVQPTSVVAPGNSTSFTLRFDPSSSGDYPAEVSISCNDTNESNWTLEVAGEGTAVPEPEMNVKQGTADVADGGSFTVSSTIVNTTKDTVFTIENLGTAALNLSGTPRVTVGGTDSALFTVTVEPDASVAPGESTIFTVHFAPTTTGAKTATLSIANDDADENPYNFSLSASSTTAPAPEMNLKQGTTDYVDGTSFTFPSTVVGSSTDAVFTIENLGTSPLNLTGTPKVVVGGTNAAMFTVTSQPSSPVAAGGNTTFTLRFTPTSGGTKSASISIANDDANENPYNLVIYGPATSAEINVKQGTTGIADGGGYTFPETGVVYSTDAVFTIENLGSGPLSLTGTPTVSIDGTDPAYFSVIVQPASSVAAGGSTTFTVRFAPGVVNQDRHAWLHIANNDSNENPYDISLTGPTAWHGSTGVDPSLVEGATAIDAIGDRVFIAYYDNLNHNLKFAYSYDDGWTWAISTVDSTGSVGQYCDLDSYYTGSSYYIYISYYDSTNGNLKLAKSTNLGGSWTISTIDNSANDVGQYNSIKGNSTEVYVSYYDSTNKDLKFAKSTNGGGSWAVTTTVDATGDVGGGTALTWYGSDVYIAYRDETNFDLKFARSTDGGATWPAANIKTVPSPASNVGLYPSIAVNSNCIFVSYYNFTNGKLLFARSTNFGSSWDAGDVKTVDASLNNVGMYSSIDCKGDSPTSDTIYISYLDKTDWKLKFARSTDGGVTWPAGNIKYPDAIADSGGFTSIVRTGSGLYISHSYAFGGVRICRSLEEGVNW